MDRHQGRWLAANDFRPRGQSPHHEDGQHWVGFFGVRLSCPREPVRGSRLDQRGDVLGGIGRQGHQHFPGLGVLDPDRVGKAPDHLVDPGAVVVQPSELLNLAENRYCTQIPLVVDQASLFWTNVVVLGECRSIDIGSQARTSKSAGEATKSCSWSDGPAATVAIAVTLLRIWKKLSRRPGRRSNPSSPARRTARSLSAGPEKRTRRRSTPDWLYARTAKSGVVTCSMALGK